MCVYMHLSSHGACLCCRDTLRIKGIETSVTLRTVGSQQTRKFLNIVMHVCVEREGTLTSSSDSGV